MSDRKYRILLTLCAIGIIGGMSLIGVGLKGKYEKRQAAIAQQQQEEKHLEAERKAKETMNTVFNDTILLYNIDAKGERTSSGTGFVIKVDSQGSYILTNKHVCMSSRMSKAEMKKEDDEGLFLFRPMVGLARFMPPSGMSIVRVAQKADLCLVRTELKFKRALKLAYKAVVGEELYSFGFPNHTPELQKGKYLGTFGGPMQWYSKTDAKVWYGSSGSPVMNLRGEVIGVMSNIQFKAKVTKKREDVEYSLFIPLEIVREFIGGIQ